MCATGSVPVEQTNKRYSVCMNWVVTVDENGRRQLRMRWRVDREDRSTHRNSLAKVVPIDSKVAAAPLDPGRKSLRLCSPDIELDASAHR